MPPFASAADPALPSLPRRHYILHAILDFIVDNYMPCSNACIRRSGDRGPRAGQALDHADVERLHIMRRDLLRLRGAAALTRSAAASSTPSAADLRRCGCSSAT
jgi:hypothetical protein